MIKTSAITPSDVAEIFGGISLQAVYKILKSNDVETKTTSNRRKLISPLGVRTILEKRGFSFCKKNLSFQIVKGGTGKTSLAYSLATRASHYGARVLAIDFDQQGNLTRSFNVDARDRKVWLHLVRDRVDIADVVIEITDTLHLLPSNLNNSRLDVELTGVASNLRDMVRDRIAPVRQNYDFVVMDCPPALNKINTAATCGSDIIIIPINPDPYAMDGLEFTLAEFERIRDEFKMPLDYKILWNRYDARERLGVFYMHELAKNPDRAQHILPVVIRTDTSVKNSVFGAKSIFELPKRSSAKDDIDQFTRELLGINEWMEEEARKQAV